MSEPKSQDHYDPFKCWNGPLNWVLFVYGQFSFFLAFLSLISKELPPCYPLSLFDVKVSKIRSGDGPTQNVKRYRYRYLFPVPNIFDTDIGTFFGTKFLRYRFRDFCPIPNFTDTDSKTCFQYQIFEVPVPIPPEKMKKSRYRNLYGTGTHYKS